MNHERLIAGWLNDLAVLAAGNERVADAKAKIAAAAGMLAERFPAEAFTRKSLDAIASQCVTLPNYAELVAKISRWWKDNRPPPSATALRLEEQRYVPKSMREPSAAEQDDRKFFADMTPAALLRRVAEVEALPITGISGFGRSALIRTTLRGITKYNPDLLPYLPPSWLPREPADVVPIPMPEPTPSPPKTAYLSPEQLAR